MAQAGSARDPPNAVVLIEEVADDGWGMGDNAPTFTTHNEQIGHSGRCVPFGSYIAPIGTR